MENKAEGLFNKLIIGLANAINEYESSKTNTYLITFTPIRDILSRLFTNEERVFFKNPNVYINVNEIKPYFEEYLKLLKFHLQFCDELTKKPNDIDSQKYLIELRNLYRDFFEKIPEDLKYTFKDNLQYIMKLG
ncbi:MAG: hypothetical protein PF569_02835 [Candidatus Woesearchaeota archaeon]|jgi:hypothetical protein|nr:hypothetical protein [Candidatus Woesearchaeota archaeon]